MTPETLDTPLSWVRHRLTQVRRRLVDLQAAAKERRLGPSGRRLWGDLVAEEKSLAARIADMERDEAEGEGR